MKNYEALRKEFWTLLESNLQAALTVNTLREQERLKKINLTYTGPAFLNALDELQDLYPRHRASAHRILDAAVLALKTPTQQNLGLLRAQCFWLNKDLEDKTRVHFFAARNLLGDVFVGGCGVGLMTYSAAVLGGVSMLAFGPFGGLAVAVVAFVVGAIFCSLAMSDARRDIRLWRGSQMKEINQFVETFRDGALTPHEQEMPPPYFYHEQSPQSLLYPTAYLQGNGY